MEGTVASGRSPALTLKEPARPRAVRADLPLLEGIISGGQTGVDQAALHAAYRLGIATGGYAPLGWRTLAGPSPWLGARFGLVECADKHYPARTARNVHAADATVRVANDFGSAGEACTLRAIKRYAKPYLDVVVSGGGILESAKGEIMEFLVRHSVRVLNVAGTSEETARGIGQVAERFLVEALGAES